MRRGPAAEACQTEGLTRPSSLERIFRKLQPRYWAHGFRLLRRDRRRLVSGMKSLFSVKKRRGPALSAQAVAAAVPGRPLGLKSGDMVRVKGLAEIERGLDGDSRFDGLYFVRSVMSRFCGEVFPVKRRIGRFFDEGRQRMVRIRDVVILDGVYCEKPAEGEEPSSGCDRMCFLFWKEAWLERVPQAGAEAQR